MPLKKINVNPNEDYFILGMDLSKDQEIDFKCLREEET
jgi:hypothetical protein